MSQRTFFVLLNSLSIKNEIRLFSCNIFPLNLHWRNAFIYSSLFIQWKVDIRLWREIQPNMQHHTICMGTNKVSDWTISHGRVGYMFTITIDRRNNKRRWKQFLDWQCLKHFWQAFYIGNFCLGKMVIQLLNSLAVFCLGTGIQGSFQLKLMPLDFEFQESF